MVLDFDGLDQEGVKVEIENTHYANHCINPKVTNIETREVEWSDDHPLNNRGKSEQAFEELFATQKNQSPLMTFDYDEN